MRGLFQRLKVVFFILTPFFVPLFLGFVIYRQSLNLKSSVPTKTEWEKFQDEVKKLKKESWQTKNVYPFKFYYQGEAGLERVESNLFPALAKVEKAFSWRFNLPLKVYLLGPEKAGRLLGKEKSYVYLKKDPFALLSVDSSGEEMDLFASRLVCYSMSNSDSSYWFREGLARYFAFEVLNKKEGAFGLDQLSKTSSFFDWSQLEKIKDVFALKREERESFCLQSASIVSYVLNQVGLEKLPFLADSLSAGSSGLAIVSYLTGQSVADFKVDFEKKLFSRGKTKPKEKEDRGQELSRLALNFYLVTLIAVLLGSILTFYFSYRWRN